MKKSLLLGICVLFVSANFAAAAPFNPVPNGGNSEFYPLMQYQMEKQETLDFMNDSENYKKKREEKDNKNSNFNPNYTPNYGSKGSSAIQPVKMQFVKDANGNIVIQSVPEDK